MIVARNGISVKIELTWAIGLGWVLLGSTEVFLLCMNTKQERSIKQEKMTETMTGIKTVMTLKATFGSVAPGPM